MYKNHEHLKSFEIKGPDYDYIDRENPLDAVDKLYDSVRFEKNGDYWISKNQENKDKVKIMFSGDITCFQNQFEEAYNDGKYDFNYEFEVISSVLNQSDLAIGNLETTLDEHAPYRTEMFVNEQNYHCNAPTCFLEGVRTAGFDMLTTANNHDVDAGAMGIGETVESIEKYGFIQTGTFNREKKHFELVNVNGFKIAIIAFATGHNNKSENFTPEGHDYMLNNYSEVHAKELIDEARDLGAEVVFTCIHWGREHKQMYNKTQVKIAEKLAELGYDCIIGSHPHVLQPFSHVTSGGKKVPVFYSMGNFVSHNTGGGPKGRTIIACVDLIRDENGIKLECGYIPAYTSASYKSRRFVVLPVVENSTAPRNKKIFEEIKKVVGEEIELDEDVAYKEYYSDITLKTNRKKVAKLDLSKVEEWPVEYDDNTFIYTIYKDYAMLKEVSSNYSTQSCAVPSEVLGVPVIKINPEALRGSTKIKKISFSRDIPYIYEKTCKDCTELVGIKFGINTIGVLDECFAGCSQLICAVATKKIKEIRNRAFADCVNLRSVKIPKNVLFIAKDAFENCPMLTIYCEKNSYADEYARENNIPFVNMDL